jgi:hypothetical protein
VDVTDGAALGADQVVMRAVRVGVVPLGAPVRGDLQHLAEGDQLTERVVDRGPGDLGQLGDSEGVHLVGRQMDVVSVEDLGHDASLRGHPPSAAAQSVQKVTHMSQTNSSGNRFRTDVTLEHDLN